MPTPPKPLDIGGRLLGGHGRALICTPLVGRTTAALKAELTAILPQGPDLVEWRVDFFDAVANQREVLSAAAELRALAGGVPIIFTRRAAHEGGEPIAIDEDAVVALYGALCASGDIDVVDYELSQPEHHLRTVRAVSQAHGVALIVSCHDFHATPDSAEMVATLLRAEREGADIAKLAVMPRAPGDVLRLLDATLQAGAALRIPLITMSMGALGAITRICGWQYGSSVTFAVGQRISAPGQIPIKELRSAMAALGEQQVSDPTAGV
jgi:3-dehydroquinate dehydratase-1